MIGTGKLNKTRMAVRTFYRRMCRRYKRNKFLKTMAVVKITATAKSINFKQAHNL